MGAEGSGQGWVCSAAGGRGEVGPPQGRSRLHRAGVPATAQPAHAPAPGLVPQRGHGRHLPTTPHRGALQGLWWWLWGFPGGVPWQPSTPRDSSGGTEPRHGPTPALAAVLGLRGQSCWGHPWALWPSPWAGAGGAAGRQGAAALARMGHGAGAVPARGSLPVRCLSPAP